MQIFISKLKLAAIIGVYPEERRFPQTILADVELTTDTLKASQSDSLTDTIDYAEVAKKLQQWTSERQCQLVESLAHYLVDKLLATFKISQVYLRLSKFPQDLDAESAGVIITKTLDGAKSEAQ